MVQKSLEEKVKLLTKVNEEKNDDASLTVRQLVALVGISKRTLQDWQKNDANLREQREETMLRGRGLKTERKRLRIGRYGGVDIDDLEHLVGKNNFGCKYPSVVVATVGFKNNCRVVS
ncbi:unnamed protein product [Clavelina lepadiformis]|uniref:Transposase n=1 Tax=Clavelina lepadiformis TaxID=159417 RepID=A0ABP0GTK1_CLALP